MRTIVLVLLVGLLLAGCARPDAAHSRAGAGSSVGSHGPKKPLVIPDNALVGKVVRVNEVSRFVVLSFPVGTMPAAEQLMSAYRNGLKVGEVKVTNMRIDDDTVADIIAGEVHEGDTVRAD